MKRGNAPIVIVVVLSVVVIGLFALLLVFGGSTTGQVVSEIEEDDFVERNYLDDPFALRAWVVSTEGVKLDIENVRSIPHLVEAIEVSGCGVSGSGREVPSKESRIFTVSCLLEKGEEFSGEVRVVYSVLGEKKIATGNVQGIVG